MDILTVSYAFKNILYYSKKEDFSRRKSELEELGGYCHKLIYLNLFQEVAGFSHLSQPDFVRFSPWIRGNHFDQIGLTLDLNVLGIFILKLPKNCYCTVNVLLFGLFHWPYPECDLRATNSERCQNQQFDSKCYIHTPFSCLKRFCSRYVLVEKEIIYTNNQEKL